MANNQPVRVTGHIDLAFPTLYVKASDLGGKDATVRIVRVESDILMMQGGKREKKNLLVMASLGGRQLGKRLVLNKTNAKLIASQHGQTIEAWEGQAITLYPTTTKCGRDTVDCVRVRGRVSRGSEELPEDMTREPDPVPAFDPDEQQ